MAKFAWGVVAFALIAGATTAVLVILLR